MKSLFGLGLSTVLFGAFLMVYSMWDANFPTLVFSLIFQFSGIAFLALGKIEETKPGLTEYEFE